MLRVIGVDVPALAVEQSREPGAGGGLIFLGGVKAGSDGGHEASRQQCRNPLQRGVPGARATQGRVPCFRVMVQRDAQMQIPPGKLV